MHTKEVKITKSTRGWSVHTIQHWSDFPAATTHKGAPTLAWAIYTQANWASQNDTAITKLAVNGKPYPRAKAEAAIRKCATGMLSYTLEDSLAALAI